ncbi:hypothetical protein HY625_00270, partial [Candidatus Uhrbacteria bacterium]|nr:hypothetical protein [Candidatus Uhrbacteria bacterium]
MSSIQRDQIELEKLLALIPSPSKKEEVRSLCAEKPELITALLQNYEQKVQAMQKGDTTAAQKILAQEKKILALVAS